MKYDDAYQLLKKTRSNIKPNDGFIQQLKEYAAEIARTNENSVVLTDKDESCN
ncbi:unnamed protein product, partial [Rotaria magnacalcarata]